jgi:predicted lipid-binding transport protein (Tim44 family)
MIQARKQTQDSPMHQHPKPGKSMGKAATLTACALFCLLVVSVPALAAAEAAPSRSGSVLNILFLGLIAYFLVRAFRRRGGGDQDRSDERTDNDSSARDDRDGDAPSGGRPQSMDRHEAARQMWSMLGSGQTDPVGNAPAAPAADGFDEMEFLEGAKLFFSRFQTVGNSRDLDELREFLSDDVYDHAMAKLATEPSFVRTEVMLVDARLMERRNEGGRTVVTVYYDAQLRKGISGDRPYHLRTAWEFSRDDGVENGLWTLDTINKIDQ